jgi:predicted Fe-Mo cluster-binding NifX family protein
MSIEKVAVPVDVISGLDSPVSGHFGHSTGFLVAEISEGGIVRSETLQNEGHQSCAEPVSILAQKGVGTLLANGMGRRPYLICQQLGIQVVKAEGKTAREAVTAYIEGSSASFGEESLCGGGDHHH